MEEIKLIPSNTEEKSLEQWEEEENRRVLKNSELEESLSLTNSQKVRGNDAGPRVRDRRG